MEHSNPRDRHDDPQVPATKAQALELLASLLASTLDGEVSTADVRQALDTSAGNDDDDDVDQWRVLVAECAHRRRSGEVASTMPAARAGPSADTQSWVCPMCETVNWVLDARKSLRRRHEESNVGSSIETTNNDAAVVSAPVALPVSELVCACCGYGGKLPAEAGEEDKER